MSSPVPSVVRRRVVTVGAVLALAATVAACGSDDPAPELPEGGTGSVYNDAIIASESHDEVLLAGGDGEMLVAVDCDADPATELHLVTVVASGLVPGVYTGVFDPPIGGELSLDASAGGEVVATTPATLDAEEYTVTFADIDDAVFTVRGCAN